MQKSTPSILAAFDTTPSSHGRINAPSLLLAFAHIHGEAGTPTEGIWNLLVGRSGPWFLSMCHNVQKGWICIKGLTSIQ
jgi:hypothetical protein